jgi:hypothetical protein
MLEKSGSINRKAHKGMRKGRKDKTSALIWLLSPKPSQKSSAELSDLCVNSQILYSLIDLRNGN